MAHCGHIYCVCGQRARAEPHTQHGALRGEAALLLAVKALACSWLHARCCWGSPASPSSSKRSLDPGLSILGGLPRADPQGLNPLMPSRFTLAQTVTLLLPPGISLGNHICGTADSSRLIATGYGSPYNTPTLMDPDSYMHSRGYFFPRCCFSG